MITKSGNALSDHILKEAKQAKATAELYAIMYANDNKPEDRMTFQKYNMLESKLRELHSITCQYLHAVECEMGEELNNEI